MSTETVETPVEQSVAEKAQIELGSERDMLISSSTQIYDSLYPQLRKLAYHPALGRRGLVRVLLALIEVPIKTYNKSLSPLESNLYMVCDRLLQAKFMLEHLVLADAAPLNLTEQGTVAPAESETVATESEK